MSAKNAGFDYFISDELLIGHSYLILGIIFISLVIESI